MTIAHTEIIKKRERDGRQVVWVGQDYLIAETGVSESYLRETARKRFKKSVPPHRRSQDILPDTGTTWRWAKIDGNFYYDYDRISDNYKALLPSRDELLNIKTEVQSKRRLSKLEKRVRKALKKGYSEYLHCYRSYKKTARYNLAKACAVLEQTVKYIVDKDIDISKNRVFIDLAKLVEFYDVAYLPNNHRRLKEKIMPILQDGESVAGLIDLPRIGNTNSVKYADDDQLIAWVYQLRNSAKNFTNTYIIRKIKTMCVMLEKPVPSDSWFSNILAQDHTAFLTAEGRYGKKGRKSWLYRGYIPTQGALHAGDCWQADGTRVNFIGHKSDDGSEKFLYVIAIRDVHSGDLLGLHLDTKEDRWGYINALRMAVDFTGYLPYELVHDRFPGHQTDEWEAVKEKLQTAGVKVTITSLPNAKSAVERMFGTIQTVFMQDSEYYYGEGIQSRRDYAHRAPEYLYQVRKRANKAGWNFDESWQEMMKVVDRYRNTKLSDYSRKYHDIKLSPRQLHEQSEKPAVIWADALLRIELFGLEKPAQIKHSGLIKTEIQRVTYHYQVDDYEVLSQYKDVRLKYDMEDLSTVYIFDQEENYLCEAREFRAPVLSGPDADYKALGKAKARLKQIEEKRKADLEDKIREAGEVELLLAGMSDKDEVSNAETEWLMQRVNAWKDTGKPRIEIDDDEDIEIDVRNQY